MKLMTGLFLAAVVFVWLGMSVGAADPEPRKDTRNPYVVSDLDPKLDGEEATIRFTITRLDGIAQSAKEGQAPSFAIETGSGTHKNVLTVWIEGELANVLDRLEMGAFQDNPLKAGTVIIATGKLTAHKTSPHQYLLRVDRWQGFRILPAKKEG